jgi:putative phage-type endonuclease
MSVDTLDRTTGLGASEAACAIGIDPYKSRLQLWGEKTGQLEEPNLDEVEAVLWGLHLQPKIAEVYAGRTGRSIRQNRADCARRHKEHGWMFATPDAVQRENGGPLGLLEIKTTNAYKLDEWADEPPLPYQVQLMHQMAVTGHSWGTICVLVGGQKLIWHDMPRNDKFINILIDHEREFWGLVETQTPPPVDGSEATAQALKRLYAADNGESVLLPEEAVEWDSRLQALKATQKEIEAQRREMENKLKAAIGDYTFGVLPDGSRYKWAKRERNEPAREARVITYRELRRVKG